MENPKFRTLALPTKCNGGDFNEDAIGMTYDSGSFVPLVHVRLDEERRRMREKRGFGGGKDSKRKLGKDK